MSVVKTTKYFFHAERTTPAICVKYEAELNAERDHKEVFTANSSALTLSSWRTKMLRELRRMHKT